MGIRKTPKNLLETFQEIEQKGRFVKQEEDVVDGGLGSQESLELKAKKKRKPGLQKGGTLWTHIEQDSKMRMQERGRTT